MSRSATGRLSHHRQAAIGLALAAAIIAGWLAAHVFGVFFYPLTLVGLALAPVWVALQCWLGVGLFIVAHDCMHGSLAPFRPRLNRAVGRLSLFLYAGFIFDRLIVAHGAHHRHPGTALDPDFNDADPDHFWRWYGLFFSRYFGWTQVLFIATVLMVEWLVLKADLRNLLLFWALPSLLSSLQLFTFGTYLPHRHDDQTFADRHMARSNDYSWLVSLLTCYHFGYHHEHHLSPAVPWWRLPSTRAP